MKIKHYASAILLSIIFGPGISYSASAQGLNYGQVDAGTRSAHDLLQRGFPQTTQVEGMDSGLQKSIQRKLNDGDAIKNEQKDSDADDQDRQSLLPLNIKIADGEIAAERKPPSSVIVASATSRAAGKQVKAACCRLRADAREVNRMVDTCLAKTAVVSQRFADANKLVAQLKLQDRAPVVASLLHKIVGDIKEATDERDQLTKISDRFSRKCQSALVDIRKIHVQFAQLSKEEQQKLQAKKVVALKEMNDACTRNFRSTPPFDAWKSDFLTLQAKVETFQNEYKVLEKARAAKARS